LEFSVNIRYRDGHANWCLACHRAYGSEWAKKNRATLTVKARDWRVNNKDKALRIARDFHQRNKLVRLAANRQWSVANKDKRRAADARHKAAKRNATPAWADMQAIAAIYREAVNAEKLNGMRMHVDHIVPLQHSLVCGLHCEANLRVISGPKNESKKNYWWPDMPEDAYRQQPLFPEPKRDVYEQVDMLYEQSGQK
jgi:5-methylcytosine-specific restriction endonuclease McrA